MSDPDGPALTSPASRGPVPVIVGIEQVGEIGRGSFSIVYRGWESRLQRWVAIKALRTTAEDEVSVRRFEREKEAIARLAHHPHVVHLYGSGRLTSGQQFLVTEFVDGGTLGEAIGRGERFEHKRIARDFAGLASALAAAHQLGVVHGDIKPANVLIHPERGLVLSDFGIARLIDRGATQQFFYTPQYGSPEQHFYQQTLPASDVYALGATIFSALTLNVPPAPVPGSDDDVARTVAEGLHGSGVDDRLADVVVACMARLPADRPDPRSVTLELSSYLAGNPPALITRTRGTEVGDRPVGNRDASEPQADAATSPPPVDDPARQRPDTATGVPVGRRRGLRRPLLGAVLAVAVLAGSAGAAWRWATDRHAGAGPLATAGEDCVHEAALTQLGALAVGNTAAASARPSDGGACCASFADKSCDGTGRRGMVYRRASNGTWRAEAIGGPDTEREEVMGLVGTSDSIVAIGSSRANSAAGFEATIWRADASQRWERVLAWHSDEPGAKRVPHGLFDVATNGRSMIAVGYRARPEDDDRSHGIVFTGDATGKVWAQQPFPTDDKVQSQRIFSVTATADGYVAGGFEARNDVYGAALWTAGPDGTDWKRIYYEPAERYPEVSALASVGPISVAVGGALQKDRIFDGLILRSSDSWMTQTTVEPPGLKTRYGEYLYNVNVIDGWFVASGWEDVAETCDADQCAHHATVWASHDGQIWTQLPLRHLGQPQKFQIARSVVAADGRWYAVIVEQRPNGDVDSRVVEVDTKPLPR